MPQTSRCWVAEGISIDRVIGDGLRDHYEPTLRDPVPKRFLELLQRADEHSLARAAERTSSQTKFATAVGPTELIARAGEPAEGRARGGLCGTELVTSTAAVSVHQSLTEIVQDCRGGLSARREPAPRRF